MLEKFNKLIKLSKRKELLIKLREMLINEIDIIKLK